MLVAAEDRKSNCLGNEGQIPINLVQFFGRGYQQVVRSFCSLSHKSDLLILPN